MVVPISGHATTSLVLGNTTGKYVEATSEQPPKQNATATTLSTMPSFTNITANVTFSYRNTSGESLVEVTGSLSLDENVTSNWSYDNTTISNSENYTHKPERNVSSADNIITESPTITEIKGRTTLSENFNATQIHHQQTSAAHHTGNTTEESIQQTTTRATHRTTSSKNITTVATNITSVKPPTPDSTNVTSIVGQQTTASERNTDKTHQTTERNNGVTLQTTAPERNTGVTPQTTTPERNTDVTPQTTAPERNTDVMPQTTTPERNTGEPQQPSTKHETTGIIDNQNMSSIANKTTQPSLEITTKTVIVSSTTEVVQTTAKPSGIISLICYR